MTYSIEFTHSAADELEAVKPFYRRRIADSIDNQLVHEPLENTTNKKPLLHLQADVADGESL